MHEADSQQDWYEAVREYTRRLVRIGSASPGPGERLVAEVALRILHEDGLADAYTRSGLDELRVSLDGSTPETYLTVRGIPVGREEQDPLRQVIEPPDVGQPWDRRHQVEDGASPLGVRSRRHHSRWLVDDEPGRARR